MIGGALTYETGLNLVITRARLLKSDPTYPGGMAIVMASEEKILHVIHELGLEDRLVVAVYNDPETHVISGEMKSIETFLSIASIMGFRATKVKVDQGALSLMSYIYISLLICVQDFIVHVYPLLFLPSKNGLISIVTFSLL